MKKNRTKRVKTRLMINFYNKHMTDKFAHRANDWDNPSKIAMTEKFVKELKLNIDLDKSWKALEIGAGTGLVGLQMIEDLKEVVFEDTSEAMLSVLKSKLNGNDSATTLHGEVFEYKQQDIDFVFSCMAFHHIPEIDKALAHLASITKQGAWVVVGDLTVEDGSFHHNEPIPHKGFDLKELSAWFKEAGFEIKNSYIYNILNRERTPGVFTDYEQFILLAQKA